VRTAIEDGSLAVERFQNYRKMQKELLHQERKQKEADIALARWKRRH
jgi:putative ribosome biogenesis GTPase RsgA